jgi:uncharacterized damage-inducible protein DinB
MQQNVQSDTSVLTVLFKHNAWANLKLLDFCEALSSEQLDATAIGCYGSIRDTLRHIVGAEVGYVSNATGRPKAPPLNWDAGFGAVKDAVRQAADDLLDLAISAREGTIVRQPQPEGTVEEYRLASLMVQAITHSTEHRTQIAAIITQLGMEPPDMAAWQYMWDIGELKVLERRDTGKQT